MKRIIEYAKTLGIVEIPSPDFALVVDGIYYGLPGLVDTAWIIRVHNKGKEMDIIKRAYVTENNEIMTTQAVDYNKLNYKYHLKSLVRQIHLLELLIKEMKENERINKMEKDFDD